MVLPIQGGVDQLKYRTKEAQEFVSIIDNTYPQYQKDQTISTMLRKLKHAIQVACNKIKELEETIQNNNHNLKFQKEKKGSQDSSPSATNSEKIQPEDMELNLSPDYKGTPETSSNTRDHKTTGNAMKE